jgi:hypothetical protein
MLTDELGPGDRVSEYVLEAPLGRGGFGAVWKARHHVFSERVVAIKIPDDREFVERLRAEGCFQERVEGEHIVSVLGLDVEHDPPYLVMEFIDGPNLREVIDRRAPLPPAEAVYFLRGVLRALARAHGLGIVHRDVKPENILLDTGARASDEGPGVFVADFGLGKVAAEQQSLVLASGSLQSAEGRSLAGTLPYMSPEQKDPRRAVDHRTDLYSAGLVFFELLTGRRPEGVDRPSDHLAGLPPAFDEFFSRCYAPLERRFSSAEEALTALAGLEAVLAPPAAEEEGAGMAEGAKAEAATAAPRAEPRLRSLVSTEEYAAELCVDEGLLRDAIRREALRATSFEGGQALYGRRDLERVARQDHLLLSGASLFARFQALLADALALALIFGTACLNDFPLPLPALALLLYVTWMALLPAVLGRTFGQTLCGLEVIARRPGGGPPGVLALLARAILLPLGLTPLQDRLSGTVVVFAP